MAGGQSKKLGLSKKTWRSINKSEKRRARKDWERHLSIHLPEHIQFARKEILHAYKNRGLIWAKEILDSHIKSVEESPQGLGQYTMEQREAMTANLKSFFRALEKKSVNIRYMRRDILNGYKRHGWAYARLLLELNIRNLKELPRVFGERFTPEQAEAMIANLESFFKTLKKKYAVNSEQ